MKKTLNLVGSVLLLVASFIGLSKKQAPAAERKHISESSSSAALNCGIDGHGL